jgi:hypothetical protein
MPVALENGFHIAHDLAHVSCLAIESHRLDECLARIKAKRIKGILGNPSYGFAGHDFDFAKELAWIEAVWFLDVEIKNIEGLYSLAGLQHFGVHPKRPPIDFGRFPELRKAVVEPKRGDRGFGSLTHLELLHIWHYRPKTGDFSDLEFPASLHELQINWANASTLESLPRLPNLRRLEIHRCRNLEFFGDLGTKFPELQHLVVSACGRVRADEGQRVVHDLPNLRHAYVKNVKLV